MNPSGYALLSMGVRLVTLLFYLLGVMQIAEQPHIDYKQLNEQKLVVTEQQAQLIEAHQLIDFEKQYKALLAEKEQLRDQITALSAELAQHRKVDLQCPDGALYSGAQCHQVRSATCP